MDEKKPLHVSVSVRHVPFVVPLVAASAGIVADRSLSVPLSVSLLGAVATLLVFVVARHRPRVALVSLVVGTVAYFAGWHHVRWNFFHEFEISRFAPALEQDSLPIGIEAIALEQPKIVPAPPIDPLATLPMGDRTRLDVAVVQVRANRSWSPAVGQANLVVDGHLINVVAGDRLRIFCRVRRIPEPLNPGERNQRAFQRADRKLCELHARYPDCVRIVTPAALNGWTHFLRRLRGHFSHMLDQQLDDANRDLGDALLLGIRESVPREQIDAFFLTGTTHLLAISGLNVGILACGFFFAARRGMIPFHISLIGVMLLTIGYALLTEAEAPVLRAAILVQVICVSWLTGRRPNGFNSLSLAAIIVLLVNPADLFRVGAQLSFLAVAALAWISGRLAHHVEVDPLERLVWRTRPIGTRVWREARVAVWRMTVASLVVWLLTLPLTMSQFHLVSPIAIVLNLTLFLPVAAVLYAGVGVLVLGWLMPSWAGIPGSVCNFNLSIMGYIVEAVQDWPGSHFWVAGPSRWWTIVFYLGVVCYGVPGSWRPNWRWTTVLIAAWFALPLMISSVRTQRDRELNCTFIAVGHGTSVLIELPQGGTILYDCGHMGLPKQGIDAISAVLWTKRVPHLDAVILSHADADHYNALPGLLKRFSFGVVYVVPEMFDQDSDALRALYDAIEQAGVPLKRISNQHRLMTEESALTRILHPPSRGFGAENEGSIVLLIEQYDLRLLLPGDLEGDGFEQLIIQPKIDTDIAMAPHHGSLSDDPRDFLDWSTPECIVISGRYVNESNSAIEFYRDRSESVFHTGLDGAVSFTFEPNGLRVDSFRGKQTEKFPKLE